MMTLVLDDLDKVLLVVGAVTLILLTLLLVICCLAPSCCLYQCCRKGKDDDPKDLLKDVTARRHALYGDEVVLAEFPHLSQHLKGVQSVQTPVTAEDNPELRLKKLSGASSARSSSAYGSLYDKRSSNGSSGRNSLAAVSLRDSIYSSCSRNLDAEQINGEQDEARSLPPNDELQEQCPHDGVPPPPPQMTLTLLTSTIAGTASADGEEPSQQQPVRFSVTLNEARSLPSRQYGGSGAVDAYAQLALWKSRLTLLDGRTRTVRRASQPAFQETFTADIRKTDLKESTLEVRVFDQDRFANSTELCEGSLKLNKVTEKLGKPQSITLPMQPSNKVLGEILLSISYLPTAQRVALSVLRAQGLKCPGLSSINPYVRIFLLTSMGRSLKRKKTSYKVNTSSPSFNDSLSFDVQPSQLEHLTFLVTICHRALPDGTPTHTEGGTSGSETSTPEQTQDVEDRFVGKVAIGRNVRGTAQRLHWMAVLSSPRKVITHWHPLH